MDGMDATVNSSTGTARASAIEDEDFQMAGKTGSSQVYRITAGQRKSGKTVSDNYWLTEHSVFVGYAPADSPKFAVVVLIEHGGGGAKVAAPIAKRVLLVARKIVSSKKS
jgi:penicillin-binding protein 2